MKISRDDSDPLDILTIKMCGLVRNMIYASYGEQDFAKARRNALELLSIVKDELNSYPK